MHQKLDLLEGWHSTVVGLPDKKPKVHSAWAATPLVELPAAGDETLHTQDVASESWDAASETGNAGFGFADAELAYDFIKNHYNILKS
jgi:hypothetical protein